MTAPLLLDTHIWVWAMQGAEERLHPHARERLEQAAAAGQIRIAAISLWEVSMLEAKGRLQLAQGCLNWIRAALAAPGTALTGLSPEIAVESSRLPGAFHGDPADRILVATARIEGMELMTCDGKILDYSANHYVNAFDARA